MASIKKLSAAEVTKKLEKFSAWTVNAKATEISKTITTPSFVGGLAYTAKVAVHAEILGHHPTIELSYGKIKIKLTTHDVKGLTRLDFDLAKRIDGLK